MKPFMNNFVRVASAALWLSCAGAWAMPLGSSARTVIPSDIQQIISVDYRMLKNSDTAMALKQQLLPDNLKQFEGALKGIGISPDQDLDQLVFAAYRAGKQSIKVVGVAQGSFSATAVLKKVRLQKIRPIKYRDSDLYSMPGGMEMTFLDENTLLFGEISAVRGALDTRNGDVSAIDANGQVSDMMGSVDSGMVWSVLDQDGTQNMLRSALGDAAKLADYETVKKRVLGSSYVMNFTDGIKFDLSVSTSDSMTAATLSTLLKAGILYRRMTASPVEKTAMQDVTVDSDSSNLQMHFQSDDKEFQSLMHSPLFAAVSH